MVGSVDCQSAQYPLLRVWMPKDVGYALAAEEERRTLQWQVEHLSTSLRREKEAREVGQVRQAVRQPGLMVGQLQATGGPAARAVVASEGCAMAGTTTCHQAWCAPAADPALPWQANRALTKSSRCWRCLWRRGVASSTPQMYRGVQQALGRGEQGTGEGAGCEGTSTAGVTVRGRSNRDA